MRAARYGDGWIPGPTANLQKLQSAQKIYRDHLKAIGIDPASRPTPLTREVIIAETDSRAREMAEKHLLLNYRDEYGGGQWKHPLIGSEDSAPVDQFEALSRERFLVGSPDTVCATLQHFARTFGVDHLVCRLYFAGIPHAFIMNELRLLAREVIPAFR
jgi:alkanesulfonate monooxygenase SsuD/methylene tetrahydromethanopterin reductase-like flavin-dependent oxidoreductase (luciferase family)